MQIPELEITVENLFIDILSVLQHGGRPHTEAELVTLEPRIVKGAEVYNRLCKQMEPVFALRSAVILLTTPEAEKALQKHINSRTGQ